MKTEPTVNTSSDFCLLFLLSRDQVCFGSFYIFVQLLPFKKKNSVVEKVRSSRLNKPLRLEMISYILPLLLCWFIQRMKFGMKFGSEPT